MSLVKLSTPRALPILMVDATDGYTEEPGLVLTVTVRKAGGAFAAASGAAPTDRGNGRYEYTPTAGELDTLGVFEYRCTGAGARNYNGMVQVVAELPGQLATGAIQAATFAAGAIDAAAIANGAIDAATFAAGAINAAAIATDAIDGDAIAASAVTEIQAGLATAAAVAALPTAAANADAVWDEARAGHVAAGSFGEGVASVQGNVTGSTGSVTAAVTVGGINANVITAASVAADAVAEIQAGLATAAAVAALPSAAQNADAVWDEALAGHLAAGSTGEALNASGGGATPSQIADAVWDEARAGHVAAGTFGEGIASVQGAVTGAVGSVTGNVGGNVVGSVGSVGANGITAASLAADAITAAKVAADVGAEIATAVNTTLSTAHGAGSWEGGGGITPAQIADAVLEELLTDHSSVVGSLAEAVMLIKGLVNGNIVRDQFVYDSGGMLTSCRMRVFPTGADAVAGTNVIATFTVTATNGINGPTNFRSTQG